MQCVIAVVMVRRGLVGQFPFFFSYTLLLPARDSALCVSTTIQATVTPASFWWGEAAAILFLWQLFLKSAGHFVRPYPFLRLFLASAMDLGRGCRRGVFGSADLDKGAGRNRRCSRVDHPTERSARFLQVCLLIVAIATMSRLGLTWRNYSLGIAAGFGVYAALDLVLLELRAHLHVLGDSAFVLLRSAAYNLGVLIWAFYFLRPRDGNPVDRLPGNDVANWNDALTEHIDKWYRR